VNTGKRMILGDSGITFTRHPDGEVDIVCCFAATAEALAYCWKVFSDPSTPPGYKIAFGSLICKLSVELDREERDPYGARQNIFREEGYAHE
jgi:hypothetical protein